ncbi:sensor histidine kinase [Oceanobacillus kapialis]|uniref:sensor histidine kinase n=1 Tax=Oceanobacillus kapialis TaxID=481353 RepID=UPI003850D325
MVYPALDEDIVTLLFRFFRLGPIAALPLILYITYEIYNSSVIRNNKILDKIAKLILNKKVIIVSFISTGIVYGINWTHYGIDHLQKLENSQLNLDYYYPVYGRLALSFNLHLLILLLLLILLAFVSHSIENNKMRSFMTTLVISSLLLFILGLTNFIPSYQVLISSIAVLIYSILILLSFIKMYNDFNHQYLNVVQRQNKLDYIGNMTASLIHEVKNSLSIIKGYSEIIPSIQKLEPQTDKMMKDVIASSKQLSNLVDAYNEFLRNDMDMEMKSENIIKCIEVAKKMMGKKLQENEVVVEINSNKKVVNAYVNETYFTQALINLIKNAIEATPQDRENKVIKLDVTEYDNNKVIIDMYDSGEGIPPENWDKVFLPYNSTKTEGTGLGLPFCSKVIFSHRGFIDIINSTSEGTHFRIQLPRNKFIEISKDS